MSTALLVVVTMVGAVGCVADVTGVEQPTTRCLALEGRTFQTVTEQGDCGLPAPGSPPAHCYWHIDVKTYSDAASRFEWQWSDVGQTLDVQCNGAAVTTMNGMYGMYSGTYSASTGVLTWNGVDYQ